MSKIKDLMELIHILSEEYQETNDKSILLQLETARADLRSTVEIDDETSYSTTYYHGSTDGS